MRGSARGILPALWRGDPGEQFCGGCGARLRAEAPAPAGSLLASPESALPAGERRQLTVPFCDLVGSTPLSQQLDAEEWRYVVAQYQMTARTAVERWGGHVAKELGDGLLVYFGWPTAREDDPERAIRAGLGILDAMVPLNAQLAGGDGTRQSIASASSAIPAFARFRSGTDARYRLRSPGTTPVPGTGRIHGLPMFSPHGHGSVQSFTPSPSASSGQELKHSFRRSWGHGSAQSGISSPSLSAGGLASHGHGSTQSLPPSPSES